MAAAQQEQKKKVNFPWKSSVAGAVAGIADVWSCHGLDRIKTHMQNHPQFTFSQAVGDIWKKGGIRAIYEGVVPMTFEAIGKVGIRYFAFDWFKNYWKKETGSSPETFTARLLGGVFAGTVESFAIVIPCELLKVRHMTQHGSTPFFGMMRQIIKEEGITALYKGGLATYLRQATNHAIRFPVFFAINDWIKAGDSTKHITPMQNLAAGAFAGMVSTVCNNPLDVIKTRMQSAGAKGSALAAIKGIYADRGISAFWAGVVPRAVRVMPGQAITFAVFEAVRKALGPD